MERARDLEVYSTGYDVLHYMFGQDDAHSLFSLRWLVAQMCRVALNSSHFHFYLYLLHKSNCDALLGFPRFLEYTLLFWTLGNSWEYIALSCWSSCDVSLTTGKERPRDNQGKPQKEEKKERAIISKSISSNLTRAGMPPSSLPPSPSPIYFPPSYVVSATAFRLFLPCVFRCFGWLLVIHQMAKAAAGCVRRKSSPSYPNSDQPKKANNYPTK